MTNDNQFEAAAACARVLASAEAVIREADRLREDRDEFLHVMCRADGAADQRREESRHE